MSEQQPGGSISRETLAAISDLDVRRARIREGIATSPLGRYLAGHGVEGPDVVLDLRAASRLAVMLQAVVDGDEAAALDAISEMPADEITALGTAAETLGALCARGSAGRRG